MRSLDELYQATAAFVALGVRKTRLTGGELLVRANLLWLVEKLTHFLYRLQPLRMTA